MRWGVLCREDKMIIYKSNKFGITLNFLTVDDLLNTIELAKYVGGKRYGERTGLFLCRRYCHEA